MPELVHDSYKSKRKLPEPTRCPKCGATFHKGRWTWDIAPAQAHEHICPACHRIQDKFPAGYVTLGGEFFRQHREEILGLGIALAGTSEIARRARGALPAG